MKVGKTMEPIVTKIGNDNSFRFFHMNTFLKSTVAEDGKNSVQGWAVYSSDMDQSIIRINRLKNENNLLDYFQNSVSCCWGRLTTES